MAVTELLTFYVDVTGIDDDGLVGTTLRAASNPLAAQIFRPSIDDVVRAEDSDGNFCFGVVTDIRPNGWLEVRLSEAWQAPVQVDEMGFTVASWDQQPLPRAS